MDKQKQIEEMVLAVYPWLKEVPIEERKQLSENVSGSMVMERLYNAGYRKIPENAVVLTREEAEQMYKQMKKQGKLIQEVKLAMKEAEQEFLKEFEQYGIQVRKETAEKFAEMIKGRTYHGQVNIYDFEVDEIAKEIAEGK